MKNLRLKIISAALAVLTLLSVSGCKGNTKKLTVVIGGSSPVEYRVDLKKLNGDDGLVSVLEYLKRKGKIDYELSDGRIVSVGHLEESSAESRSICVYTSVAKDADTAADRLTVDYKGETYAESKTDIYDMTLEEGAVIYIGYIRIL